MSTAVVTRQDEGAIMESVIIKGDISKLSPAERSKYYSAVCKSLGLNPLTQPFDYITINGKLTLYALRACTDQLRTIHSVSVEELTETERDGVFIVTAKVRNGQGRTDMAKGAVTIANLKGEALANALMKAETKAKRRATLSICGLGFLDETEIETIRGVRTLPQSDPPQIAKPMPTPPRVTPNDTRKEVGLPPIKGADIYQHDPDTGEVTEEPLESKRRFIDICKEVIRSTASDDDVKAWWRSDEHRKDLRTHGLTQAEVDELKDMIGARHGSK